MGGNHSCGLREDDTVTCWGWNVYGQTDAPAGTFKSVTAGGLHICGLRSDDSVTCWGANEYKGGYGGYTGQADAPAGSFKAVDAGDRHTCGVRDDNTITCWGNNDFGQGAPPSGSFKAVAIGLNFVCGILADGTIACWGSFTCNLDDAICDGDARYGQADVPAGTFKSIAVGTSHSCGLRSDDTVACWAGAGVTGQNVGQLDVPSGSFKAISATAHHTCGLRSDSTVACWGANEYGQSDAPAGRFEAVTAGGHHSCGLREDGTVTCWGSNGFFGQYLGQADAPTGSFKAIAAGHYNTCGLRSDSTVACWGDLSEAPLGSFRAITAGCGLRSDSTVTCWGSNQRRQAEAPSGSFKAIASGGFGNCGLRSDGSVACWGSPSSRTPVPVGTVESQAAVPAPLDTSLWVSLDSTAANVVTGPFDVDIHFSEAVEGFTASDMRVSNGRVVSLTGSGRVYTAVIEPVSDGDVVVRVPADAANDERNRGNQPSPPITRTTASDGRALWRAVDTWDRAVVQQAYLGEFHRVEPDWGYTGDVADCVAGTTSQRFRDSVFQRVNWYRQMAGLSTVRENQGSSAGAQHTALMMLAEGRLSHEPHSNWACYTSTGRGYAGANLVLDAAGAAAIDSFMQDQGEQNTEVGHRRWILHPQTREMGTGNARNEHQESSALWPRDANTHSTRPQVREQRGFVAWPPSGYVPPQAVWGRWSFSLAGADFSGASVNVSDDDGPVEADVIHRSPVPLAHEIRFPEETIVWALGGDTDSSPLPAPRGGDHCYIVTITGVQDQRHDSTALRIHDMHSGPTVPSAAPRQSIADNGRLILPPLG